MLSKNKKPKEEWKDYITDSKLMVLYVLLKYTDENHMLEKKRVLELIAAEFGELREINVKTLDTSLEAIERFLEEFQHYSEHFPRRLSGFFEDYDACGELLSSEERQTLRNQVASMMNVLAALDEKMQSRESKNKDATKVVA